MRRHLKSPFSVVCAALQFDSREFSVAEIAGYGPLS